MTAGPAVGSSAGEPPRGPRFPPARRFVPADDRLRSLPAALVKRISGGQTGADQGALAGTLAACIPTGGSISKGFRTEAGPAPWLGMICSPVEVAGGYPERTKRNVLDSDGTLIYARRQGLAGGTDLALDEARRLGRPHDLAVAGAGDTLEPGAIASWTWREEVRFLNVAGPRGPKDPRIEEDGARELRALIESSGPTLALARLHFLTEPSRRILP